MTRQPTISLGLLAGGRASRLDGADKAFLRYQNETLCQRIVNQLPDVFSERLISARTADERFSKLDLLPILDTRTSFSGPLAGIEALINACHGNFLLTIPVDIKFIPVDLIQQWLSHPEQPGITLQDGNGLQPLLTLWHVASVKAAITQALDQQQNAVHPIISRLNFKISAQTHMQIGNLNTPKDFESL